MRSSALCLLAVLFPPVVAAQGQVFRVDDGGGPGVDATEIAEAIEMASDGDLILVEHGTYAPFEVVGKGLTIQARDGAAILADFNKPPFPPAITVADLSSAQAVVIRNFVVFQFGASAPAIQLRDCSGPIALEELFVDFLGGYRGIDVRDCASVTLLSSIVQIAGLTPETGDPADAPGIDILRSTVYASGLSVVGGSGFPAFQGDTVIEPPSDGAPGIRVRGSTLSFTGEVGGGRGGGVNIGCFVGGNGGTGIVVDDDGLQSSTVHLRNALVFGAGGGTVHQACGAMNGQAGEEIDLIAGTVDIDPSPTRSFLVESPAAPQSSLQVQLIANPGDLAFLLVGRNPIPGLFLPASGVTVHTLPVAVVPLGTLSQQVSFIDLPTPGVNAPLEFRGFHMQVLYLGGGNLELTLPSHTVIVQ